MRQKRYELVTPGLWWRGWDITEDGRSLYNGREPNDHSNYRATQVLDSCEAVTAYGGDEGPGAYETLVLRNRSLCEPKPVKPQLQACLLAPNGDYYLCNEWNHDPTATAIAVFMDGGPKSYEARDLVEAYGWIHVSAFGHIYREDLNKYMSNMQLRVLGELLDEAATKVDRDWYNNLCLVRGL